ncbi:MAG: hypothetical protein ACK5L3_03540 [Oscillospiraceae bacterium]
MKKKLLACLALLLCSVLLAACGGQSPAAPAQQETPQAAASLPAAQAAEGAEVNEDLLVIPEVLFDAQCRDILTNPEDYAEKTVQIEGLYYFWDDALAGTRHSVVRYHPAGCCGGGLTGLEIYYESDTLPKADEWVRATGTIEVVPLGQYPLPFPVLKVTSLEVLEVRGQEYVNS